MFWKANILPATGHKFGKWIERTKSTCTENGEEVRQCLKCGKKETRAIKKIGHNFSDWRIEGDYKIRDCKNCGKTETVDLIKEREEKERKKQEAELKKEQEEIKETRRGHISSLIAILVLFVLPIGGCITAAASNYEGAGSTIGFIMLLIGGGFWVWIIINWLNTK